MNEHRHFNIGSFGGLLCVASPLFQAGDRGHLHLTDGKRLITAVSLKMSHTSSCSSFSSAAAAVSC